MYIVYLDFLRGFSIKPGSRFVFNKSDTTAIVHTEVFYALLDGTNVRLNWNIESDMNVYWI